MPELPEVERARRRLEKLAKGRRITSVIALDDTIVFSGTTAAAFATTCQGRKVNEVRRKGKNFYLILDQTITPIFHFGMSGTAIVRGEAGPVYRAPRAKTDPELWPPKYAKACFEFDDGSEWAFCDARRLGRIKLVEGKEPEKVEPLVSLGADPFLDMPSVSVLAAALAKRHAPIKAVLLDQNGPLCGIGNWMVDEILFQSRLHPSHPSSALTLEGVTTLHSQIVIVTNTACSVDANADLFPKHWLFGSRWGKGKKDGKQFVLPNGETTSITFVTVGGRTSAVIESVQKLPKGMGQRIKELKVKPGKRKATDEYENIQAEEHDWKKEEAEEEVKVEVKAEQVASPHFRKNRVKRGVTGAEQPQILPEPSPTPSKPKRRASIRSSTRLARGR